MTSIEGYKSLTDLFSCAAVLRNYHEKRANKLKEEGADKVAIRTERDAAAYWNLVIRNPTRSAEIVELYGVRQLQEARAYVECCKSEKKAPQNLVGCLDDLSISRTSIRKMIYPASRL